MKKITEMLWFAVAFALVAALGVAADRYIRQLETARHKCLKSIAI
jgi:hypothetical protein